MSFYLPTLKAHSVSNPKKKNLEHAHDLTTPSARPSIHPRLVSSAYCLIPIQFSRDYPVTPHSLKFPLPALTVTDRCRDPKLSVLSVSGWIMLCFIAGGTPGRKKIIFVASRVSLGPNLISISISYAIRGASNPQKALSIHFISSLGASHDFA